MHQLFHCYNDTLVAKGLNSPNKPYLALSDARLLGEFNQSINQS